MKLRVSGTRAECAVLSSELPARLGGIASVVEVSDFYPNRGGDLGRVYMELRAAVPGAPESTGGLVAGCEDFREAQGRALGLTWDPQEPADRWTSIACQFLALLLHAAAVSGRDERDVLRWITEPTPAGRGEVVEALRAVPDGGAERAQAASSYFTVHPRTWTSISTTLACILPQLHAGHAPRVLGHGEGGAQ
jgi:hypothetical protein